jgi:hypothetical protein
MRWTGKRDPAKRQAIAEFLMSPAAAPAVKALGGRS